MMNEPFRTGGRQGEASAVEMSWMGGAKKKASSGAGARNARLDSAEERRAAGRWARTSESELCYECGNRRKVRKSDKRDVEMDKQRELKELTAT